MNINFINSNSTEQEKQNININNVNLSFNNPRFTVLPKLDMDIIEFIQKKSNIENEIIFKLFFCEGNLNDLIKLLESINDNGFDNKVDPIMLTKNEKNEYFVAEGNRRILCLKLINNINLLPKWCDFSKQAYSNYSNANDEYLNGDDETSKKDFLKNYEKIQKIIKEINNNHKQFDVYYKIVIESNDLWKIIYDKHNTGERPGMRKWSRAKYFADLLSLFGETGIDSTNQKKSLFKINREYSIVVNDFKEAQYIYLCFWFGENKNFDEDKELYLMNDKDIINDLIFTNKISALERKFTWNKIINVLKSIEFNPTKISDKEFKSKYINLYYDDKNKIKLSWNLLKPHKIFNYIYNLWKKGKITTRSISEDVNLALDLKLLIGDINIKNKLSDKQIEQLNEFDFSINDLKEIIKNNSLQNNKTNLNLKRFKLAKEIKEKLNEIEITYDKEYSNMNEPIGVFLRLYDQMKHNEKPKMFLNALGATLRSFWEQIVIWLYLKLKKNKSENVTNDIVDFIWGRVNILFKDIVEKRLGYSFSISEIVGLFVNENLNEKMYCDFLFDFCKKTGKNNSYAFLCNFIHASHKIYKKESYVENLKRLKSIIYITNKFTKNFDFKKIFFDINNLILEELHKNPTNYNPTSNN